MAEQKLVDIQRLERPDDLDLLIRGYAVPIIYPDAPLWKHDKEKHIGAYHGKSDLGLLQFLIPASMGEKYIIMYQARKNHIEIRDGNVILNEDKSVTESFNQSSSKYSKLNKTLQISGLRA